MRETLLQTFAHEHAPCYVYDAAVIESQAHTLKRTLDGFDLLYSLKSNPFPGVVRTLAGVGVGADAASAAEVSLARENGVAAEDIFYSSAGKTAADIESVLGECVLIADSLGELAIVDDLARRRGRREAVGIRVNPDFTMRGDGGVPSTFGIDAEQLPHLAERLDRFAHISLRGLHVHVQSQILDAERLSRYYDNCFRLAERLAALPRCAVDFLNFGGGVGMVYDPAREQPLDAETLQTTAARIVARNRETLRARLLVESGRFLVCAAGVYCARIVDIKESRGEKYLIVQNGLNGFLRPAVARLLRTARPDGSLPAQEPLYTSDHAFAFTVLNDAPTRETVHIVGNLCTTADTLARNATVNTARVGDIVAVGNAGSYAYSLSPLLFSSHPLPGQYLVDAEGRIID